MKKYALSFLATLVLVGCGGESDSSDGMGPITKPEPITNSSVCYNNSLYAVGAELVQEYTQTLDGVEEDNVTIRQKVNRLVSYGGYSDVLEVQNTDELGNITLSYIQADDALKSLRTLLVVDGDVEYTYEPSGTLQDFDLDVGEIREYPTVTINMNGKESSTVESSIKYVKSQSVRVPAGEFNTCLMEIRMELTNWDGTIVNAVLQQNVGIGNGLVIKEEMETVLSTGERVLTASDLVEGSLNGNIISP
ncbi:hypothetical protein L4C36_10290 [Photobacterium japonica]|uniref:hypothetical protein n=1 Tax=Photobacterium japonica TaxID=2910235 RepID=UPI003D15230F